MTEETHLVHRRCVAVLHCDLEHIDGDSPAPLPLEFPLLRVVRTATLDRLRLSQPPLEPDVTLLEDYDGLVRRELLLQCLAED